MEWISVKDRLPEVAMKPVLVYGPRLDGERMPVRIAYWNEYWCNWISHTKTLRNVTHWAEIQPPKLSVPFIEQ